MRLSKKDRRDRVKKIGIVGAGLVGSCFKGLDEFEVVHHNEWKDKIRGWSGVVNCAASSE